MDFKEWLQEWSTCPNKMKTYTIILDLGIGIVIDEDTFITENRSKNKEE